MEFSKRLDLFGDEIFAALNERKVALEAQGRTIYNLSVGTPDFAPAEHIRKAMMDAAAHVETGSVTFAARDSELDGRPIKQGEIMGMCGSKIKFLGDDIVDIAFKTVDKLFKRGEHALVTLIYGADATEEQAQELETRLSEKYGSDMEISIVDGGQPIYYFLLSVE